MRKLITNCGVVGGIMAAGAISALALTGCSGASNSAVDGNHPSAAPGTVSAGYLNTGFVVSGTGLDQPVDATVAYPNGSQPDKVIIGGRFTRDGGQDAQYLARLNPDGSLDAAFNPAGHGPNGRVRALAVQSNGQILVGGEFTKFSGANSGYLVRLNADGTPDKTFNQQVVNGPVWGIAIEPNGQILAGGLMKEPGSTPSYLVRLNANGSVDSTYKGPGLNGYVKGIALQSDGKIVIGGDFTSPTNNLARLNTDGTLDSSFAAGKNLPTEGYVDSVIIDPQGRILMGGWFTSYGGAKAQYVARLTSTGVLDTTFQATGTGLNLEVKTMALQPNGQLVVGGDFTQYNGTSTPAVARLNSDGSLDSSFAQTGNGILGNANSIALTRAGNVVVAGAFLGYDTTAVNNALELLGSAGPAAPMPPTNVVATQGGKDKKKITVTWSAPALTGSNPISAYQVTATQGSKTTLTCKPATLAQLTCDLYATQGGTTGFNVTVVATAGTLASQPSAPVAVTPAA